METDVEVARNTLEFNMSSQSAALMLLKLFSYSVVQGFAMGFLFFPRLCREDVTVLTQSVFVHFSVVVGDMLTETVFNIETKDVTGDIRVLDVDVDFDFVTLMASLESQTRVSFRVHVITHLASAQYDQNASADERYYSSTKGWLCQILGNLTKYV